AAHALQYRVAYVINIEVKQARFDPEDQDARHSLVIRVSRAIRITARAGDATEKGYVWLRGAPQQLHQRDNRADQHATQQSRSEHAQQCGAGDSELGAVGPPQMT